jgi:hypothetical protein
MPRRKKRSEQVRRSPVFCRDIVLRPGQMPQPIARQIENRSGTARLVVSKQPVVASKLMPPGLRVLLAQLFSTAALTGLIWTIQILQYPLFAQVGEKEFPRYHASHSARITAIVGPLMGLEMLCALYILWRRPLGVSMEMAWGAMAILIVVHLTTTFLSVPAHNVLGRGFSANAHHKLVWTNWIRTVAWSARAVLSAAMIVSAGINRLTPEQNQRRISAISKSG